jgi:UDP-2,4-diacetamido-2,4,6-trideoxy-beta-L-altropyranose hydrolase
MVERRSLGGTVGASGRVEKLTARCTWGIRVASSPRHGAGHMNRCLALAENLEGGVRFFLDGDFWAGRLREQGWACELESAPEQSTRAVSALQTGALRALIFDGYDLRPEDAEQAMKQGYVVHIDDGETALAAHCNINPAAEPIADSLARQDLFGLKYALLNPTFAAAHECAQQDNHNTPEGGLQVLISMGARDSKNVTSAVLDMCQGLSGLQNIRVIMGAHADHLDVVRTQIDDIDTACLVVDCQDMIAEYERADVALGAGGVSLLERLCCGLPSLIVTQSHNQLGNVKMALDAGAIGLLGTADSLDRTAVRAKIETLAHSPATLNAMCKSGLELVDGHGASRAAAQLGSFLRDYEDECSGRRN